MSAVVRAGYKQTEVGVIPGDWSSRELASFVDPSSPICYGVVQVGQYVASGVPIVAIKFVKEIAWAPLHKTATTLEKPYFRSRPRGGDVLISIKGTIGRVGIVPNGFQGNISRELARLRVNSSMCPEYVAHQLEAEATQERIMRAIVGTTRLEFSIAAVRQFRLPIPPTISEQRAIATALSDVDALLAKLDALIAKKRDLKVATMQQLLTGQTRLPGFSGEWAVKRLGDLLSRMANGAVYKPTNSRGIQITRIETIADGTIDYSRTGVAEDSPELERYKIMLGDILFSHINSVDHIGKVAIFNGEQPLYHGMNLLLLRTNKDADCNFLYLWFTSLPARRQTRNLAKQAVSQASINTKELKALEMRLPPLQEQAAIAQVLSDMNAELAALEARRDKTRAIKQGMMQELLTGRIRLL